MLSRSSLNKIKVKDTIYAQVFSAFQVDWNSLLKNKVLILKNYPGFTEQDLDRMSYFQLEEYIKIINQMSDEELKDRKKQEDEQKKSMGSFNPSSYMKNMPNVGSVMNKFKK